VNDGTLPASRGGQLASSKASAPRGRDRSRRPAIARRTCSFDGMQQRSRPRMLLSLSRGGSSEGARLIRPRRARDPPPAFRAQHPNRRRVSHRRPDSSLRATGGSCRDTGGRLSSQAAAIASRAERQRGPTPALLSDLRTPADKRDRGRRRQPYPRSSSAARSRRSAAWSRSAAIKGRSGPSASDQSGREALPTRSGSKAGARRSLVVARSQPNSL